MAKESRPEDIPKRTGPHPGRKEPELSGWGMKIGTLEPERVKLHWTVHVALWLTTLSLLAIAAIELYSAFIFFAENPQWWPL